MSRLNTKLITGANLENVDDIYQSLIDVHDGLSDEESLRLNAKLILLLFNHVGDEDVIYEALDYAKSS
ncbi:MAG: hypothetical protein COA43_13010 [Robiginitomaculum sp.]|nr:MAG: hypothetical protein COA43_13010 [Robiginitomaculum sp.]